ncbi:GNAT family N-acetyltransferase [Pelagibacterium lacus]|uniref:GNAT family N-acetyltransferase n=1 Tax=Pelagibacterium lacus TaxID=2282655 RepID=A0A369W778_9HYPH|nr:GNAT family N-acetyltransferase [Pelagibacterium lacus]RDE09200.1 GNAT family N-acetyltransferase [Pelagibacterium lacus]
MAGNPSVVVDKILNSAWADHLFSVMKTAEREGQFSAHSIYPGRTRALLAFSGQGRDPADLVGFLTYILGEDDIPPAFMVNVLYVLPEHRRKGVAEQLMRSAIAMAVNVRSSDFSLHVKQDNSPMRGLLKKMNQNLNAQPFRYNLAVVPKYAA